MTYSGGAEVGFGPGFGVSADLTSYGFDFLPGDARSAAVHAFYKVNQSTSIGAFYGYDSLGFTLYDPDTDDSLSFDLDGTFYGAEVQGSYAGATIEAFLGRSEGDVSDGTMSGLSGQYLFGPFGITAEYLALDDESAGVFDRYSFGGEWTLGMGPTLYAEWGAVGGEEREEFFTLGARIGIGANRGTTFGPRSVFEISPGF
jgi:hypothetical protein